MGPARVGKVMIGLAAEGKCHKRDRITISFTKTQMLVAIAISAPFIGSVIGIMFAQSANLQRLIEACSSCL
jgi:hypothetical protein